MNKQHITPEFQVICQNEANAKFFVASFENQGQTAGTTSDVASFYNDGGEAAMW